MDINIGFGGHVGRNGDVLELGKAFDQYIEHETMMHGTNLL